MGETASEAGTGATGVSNGGAGTPREFVRYTPDGQSTPDGSWRSRHRNVLAVALMSHWYSTGTSREEAADRLQEARAKTEGVANLAQKNVEVERARAEAEDAKADADGATMSRAAEGESSVRLDADGESEEANAGADGAKEVSEAIREITGDADEQREMLDPVSTAMTDLSATVEEVADVGRTTADGSENASAVAEEQAASMSRVSANVTSILAAFEVIGGDHRPGGPDATTGAPTL